MFEIIIRTEFIGFHRWRDAPDECSFLRSLHRHTFTVQAEMRVEHSERHVEFISLKRQVDRFIHDQQTMLHDTVVEWSCEQWAKCVGERFGFSRVEVFEDGENGGRWTRD